MMAPVPAGGLGQLYAFLRLGPELAQRQQFGVFLGPQQEKIIAGTEPFFVQQPLPALAAGLGEPGLHQPDLPGDRAVTAGYGGADGLLGDHLLRGGQDGHVLGFALFHQPVGTLPHGLPEQCSEQESGCNRQPAAYPIVGIFQGFAQHGADAHLALAGTPRHGREQRPAQAEPLQGLHAAQPVPGQEQLVDLFEQAGRGNVRQQVRQPRNGFGRRFIRHHAELGLEPRRAQQAHGVFRVAHVRVADQAQASLGQVPVPTHVIADLAADRIEEQRVDRKIAPEGVLLDVAEHVVAQDAAVIEFVLVVVGPGHAAERRHLDQGAAFAYMRQAEPPADQPAARKHVVHFLGGGAGGHVEVLGRLAQQQVAHAAADDEGLVAGVLQILDDFAGVRAQLLESDAVLGRGNSDVLVDDFCSTCG